MFFGAPLAVLATRKTELCAATEEALQPLETVARLQYSAAEAECELENCLFPERKFCVWPSLRPSWLRKIQTKL